MDLINEIFKRIECLTHEEGYQEFTKALCAQSESKVIFQKSFLQKIFKEIDDLAAEIKSDSKILISVKNQKLLRRCFQLIASFGFAKCLLPGLGIDLSKRCSSATVLPDITLSDTEKYELLVDCTDFFTRSYTIPVLKNIIMTFHLCDYLAALIQLSFAPLKKPGTYKDFIMSQELYNELTANKVKYTKVYEHLVTNCFQPTLMKELLVLQSVKTPNPPAFVRRVITKEMSQRLLAPGGLLSLIRCFIESYSIDTGFEWKKIDMICKIVSVIHGNWSEDDYLKNMSGQLKQILSLKNTHYLATAVSCVLSLNEKYPSSKYVAVLIKEIFLSFSFDALDVETVMPGTVALTPQEVEHKLKVLHACIADKRLDIPVKLLTPNIYILFLLGIKSNNNVELAAIIREILLLTLEMCSKEECSSLTKNFLFGKNPTLVDVEEYEAGLGIKFVTSTPDYPKKDAFLYFINLLKASSDQNFIQNIFEIILSFLSNINNHRQNKYNKEILLSIEDDPLLIDDDDENYALILQLLTEICSISKVVSSVKSNPGIILNFMENFLLEDKSKDTECATIALVLLNTILSNINVTEEVRNRFSKLAPILKKIGEGEDSYCSILINEAMSLLSSDGPSKVETAYSKALTEAFDDLLPVRAHGVIELTKLIELRDPETLSMKHYVFCLFQEHLKDSDSYIYLSAINGIAALGSHCTEDVLHVLCKEFLQDGTGDQGIETNDSQNRTAELRMKIGDAIVKVTKKLGELAVVHKTILLNTMLCGSRDEDPLIRTSALSNLAEIALVLNYRIGTIIYEVLLCIWSIIESDKAIECRRAAVMVISSLIKGLGNDTLVQLKDNLLPVYRTLKTLYNDPDEDDILKLHAQIALEELNDIVKQSLFPEVKMDKNIFLLDK